jgi:AcrR family transcriptional regulator
MPKVSAAHMEARREQILAAARRCFTRDGFHATSMQDLIDEAGVSAGGLYRHFASKDEIVLAIARDNLHEVVSFLEELGDSDSAAPSMGAALGNVLRLILAKQDNQGVAGLAVMVWGEVLRDEQLADAFKKTLRQLQGDLARRVRDLQTKGTLDDTVTPDVFARVFFAVIPGFLLQLAVFGPRYVRDMPAAVEAMWSAS